MTSPYLALPLRPLAQVAPDLAGDDLSFTAFRADMERRYDQLPEWWWNPTERERAYADCAGMLGLMDLAEARAAVVMARYHARDVLRFRLRPILAAIRRGEGHLFESVGAERLRRALWQFHAERTRYRANQARLADLERRASPPTCRPEPGRRAKLACERMEAA